MKPLHYHSPSTLEEAITAVQANPQACFLGGGTNVIDHLKLGVRTPEHLVDVRRLPLNDIEHTGRGLRIGANVRNSDLAAHPVVRAGWPVISRALLSGASGQIRNMATTAGNLLQRTRCLYFQDITTPCNKREPGSGCSAVEGYGHYNAILGASEQCVATHPSDLAVALTALDAEILTLGPEGERRIPIQDLHTLPGAHPEVDHVLAPGELITAVEVPASGLARSSTYVKTRDRASFAFALVSVAAALQVKDGVVAEVAIAWGGVAHKPWRASVVEDALLGRGLDEAMVGGAVDKQLEVASFGAETAYKRPLLRGAMMHALNQLIAEEQR
ncbi:4-hydroxybenzoyl-CoA reductase subunit beta [Corynebacterium occultum]|uniref:4-hydroxybenzoyl-CoA reductase subunit beta n=1 Tax=Corynebacterium occultum TaxID=2675219 RepID=A0A6B8W1F9_9CORY|nr:xanthine dehydrogenase family protein subunit M [Corynebacterium occultum]QGU07364.1 4-hydroxybenzoyl-CoA reductase subunit beta [Corynebacterium occultum]